MTTFSEWRRAADRHGILASINSLACILAIIFCVEFLVMQLLPYFSNGLSPLMENLADATLLTLFSTPFLWLIVARPLESAARAEKLWGASLLGAVRDGVIIFDHDGKVVMINRAAEEQFSCSSVDMAGRPFADIVQALDGDVTLEEIPAQLVSMAGAAGPAYHETIGYRSGGDSFPVEISISQAERRQRQYFVAIMRDISYRRRLEEESARARQDWEDVFSSITDAITVIDDQYEIVRANPAAAELLGTSLSELVGGKCCRLFHGVDQLPENCQGCEVMKSCGPSSREFYEPNLHKYLEVKVLPQLDSKKQAVGTIHVVRDITERKYAEEELRKKNAELERYIYSASHDLKTPVVTIKLFLSMFEEHLASGDITQVKADMCHLQSAADRMGHLLEDILSFSQTGLVTSCPVDVALGDLIDEALNNLAGVVADRQVAIRVVDHDITLQGDRRRLVEVWQNLIENGIKFMGNQSAPCIEIGIHRDRDTPVFYVCDNGTGIDPKYFDKIFGLFEQLDPSAEGTGVGLAIVRRIIEIHGGKIWIESAGIGQGSCFLFTLPGLSHRPKG